MIYIPAGTGNELYRSPRAVSGVDRNRKLEGSLQRLQPYPVPDELPRQAPPGSLMLGDVYCRRGCEGGGKSIVLDSRGSGESQAEARVLKRVRSAARLSRRPGAFHPAREQPGTLWRDRRDLDWERRPDHEVEGGDVVWLERRDNQGIASGYKTHGQYAEPNAERQALTR